MRMPLPKHFTTSLSFAALTLAFAVSSPVQAADHNLAGKTRVLSAENWLRAEEPQRAADVYEALIEDGKASPDLLAQALYWCGESYMRMADRKKPNFDPEAEKKAYIKFKKLTWEYPDSSWTKYARGRLATMKEPTS